MEWRLVRSQELVSRAMTFCDDDLIWAEYLKASIQFANEFPLCKGIMWWLAPDFKVLVFFETGIVLHDFLRIFLGGASCYLIFYFVDEATELIRPSGLHIPKHEPWYFMIY